MSSIKALLYTILMFVFWALIQLAILLPIKFFYNKPTDFTHSFGITKIISVLGSFLMICYFFWTPKFDLKKALSIQNYNLKIIFYLLIIGIGITLFNRSLLDFYKLLNYSQDITANNNSVISNTTIALIYNFISTIIIAPIVEELFYRKFLLDNPLKNSKPVLAMIVSSLCFSAVHIENPNNLLPAFICGIILAKLYYKTRKIGYCILLHAIINLIIMILNTQRSFDNWLDSCNFNMVYWLIFISGVIITLVGINKIPSVKT